MTNQSEVPGAEVKTVDTQFGVAHSADLEEKTWTFLMPDGFNVWSGRFAIVDVKKYEQLLAGASWAVGENARLREALEKIRGVQPTYDEAAKNEYKFALNRTWHIASEALLPTPPIKNANQIKE